MVLLAIVPVTYEEDARGQSDHFSRDEVNSVSEKPGRNAVRVSDETGIGSWWFFCNSARGN
jgi:hypothetical protein